MKKRNLLALLLAVVMVVSLFAGCGGKEENPTAAPTAAPTDSNATTAPTAAPDDNGSDTEEVTWANELIMGSTTEPSGDFKIYWQGNATDGDVFFFTSIYTVTYDYDTAEYIFDGTVVKDHSVTANPDGSKTVTIELNPDLKWSDGSQVTSKDFIRRSMLFSSPLIVATGGYGSTGTYDLGYKAFNKGETAIFEGFRMFSDTKFAVTVDSDWMPDYFENRYYQFVPEHKNWLPDYVDIADDGEGCYFTVNGEKAILDGSYQDEMGDTIENWRWNCNVFCGPYCLANYDTSGMIYTLHPNPYYLGDYEGNKGVIESFIIKGVKTETMMDELKTGQVTFIKQSTEGANTNAGLSMHDDGLVNYSAYDRNGYGAMFFKCSVGPMQFKEARHAVAYLLDRNDFCRAFTEGFGMVVHGPYGSGMWMTQQGQAELDERLNAYNYSVDNAIAELEAGGWTLAADGSAYTSGLRYKEVTAEEAGVGDAQYPGCVTLSDGRILMPLHINWASSENNPVSDLLATKLALGAGTAQAGMEIEQTIMTFNEMLSEHYNNRDEHYYCAFNLATGFAAAYDMRLSTEYGSTSNVSNINDPKMHQLAVDMLLVEPGDSDTFLELWLDFIEEWNDYLPAMPLYSNTYYDFFTPHLQNYNVASAYVGVQSLLRANIEGYPPAK